VKKYIAEKIKMPVSYLIEEKTALKSGKIT
jgi:hypothetical protein